jgi:hypothetical protein
MMAHTYVMQTVEEYLHTNWPRHPATVELRVINDDNAETPESGGPFGQIQFPVSRDRRLVIGERWYEQEGGIRVVISVPRGMGAHQLGTWLEEIKNLLRDRNLGGGLKTDTPSGPTFDDRNDEGAYFTASIVAPYRYTYLG